MILVFNSKSYTCVFNIDHLQFQQLLNKLLCNKIIKFFLYSVQELKNVPYFSSNIIGDYIRLMQVNINWTNIN